MQAGLVALAAALVLVFHARRLRQLVRDPEFDQRRGYLFYLYAVCLVTVMTTLAAGSIAAYGLVQLISPTAVSSGPSNLERDEGVVNLVSNGFLAAAAAAIFTFHWRRASRLDPTGRKAVVHEDAGS